MKKFFGFLFGYGQLGWKTRLAQPDHLYHQGRNFLALMVCYVWAALFTSILIPLGILFLTGQPTWISMSYLVACITIAGLPIFYVMFASVKLTILRLHDFNLSGWWVLLALVLGGINVALESPFPGISHFVSLPGLAYLTLLILPASAQPNRFGAPEVNDTAGKPRFIRAVPLIFFAFSWLLNIASAFATQHAYNTLRSQAQLNEGNLAEMQEFLKQQQLENATPAVTFTSPTQVSATVPAAVSTTAPEAVSSTVNPTK